MKKMNLLCAVLCALLLVTIFAACDANTNDTTETQASTTQQTTADTRSPAEDATSAATDAATNAETQGETATEAQAETTAETTAESEVESEVESEAETEAETEAQDVLFSTEVAKVYYNIADLNGLYVVRSEVNAKGMLLRELYLDLMSNMIHPLTTLSYGYDDEGNLTSMVYTDIFYGKAGTAYLDAEGKETDGDSYVEFYENGLLKKRSITVDGEIWLCEYDELGRRVHELYEDFDSVWLYEGSSFDPVRYELEDIGEGKSAFDLSYENGQLKGIIISSEGQTATYTVSYDLSGYVTAFGITFQEKVGIMTQYTWNEKGQFTEIINGGSKYTFEYDADGNNTKVTVARISGDTSQISEVYTYAYENGLKVSGKRDNYNDDGSPSSSYFTYEWAYNDKGDMTSYTSSWFSSGNGNTSVNVTVEEYKPNGSRFRETHIDYSNGQARSKTVREYENGLCVIECRYYAHEGDVDQEAAYYMAEKVEREYNENHRESKVTTTRYNEAGEMKNKSVRIYTYDENGNSSCTETQYDANGNVIEQK